MSKRSGFILSAEHTFIGVECYYCGAVASADTVAKVLDLTRDWIDTNEKIFGATVCCSRCAENGDDNE